MALASYQSLHAKSHMAADSSAECVTKIAETQSVNLTIEGLTQPLYDLPQRSKIMFIDLVTGTLDDLAATGTESSRKILYTTIGNLLEEHKQLARTTFEQNAKSNIN